MNSNTKKMNFWFDWNFLIKNEIIVGYTKCEINMFGHISKMLVTWRGVFWREDLLIVAWLWEKFIELLYPSCKDGLPGVNIAVFILVEHSALNR
jgi:hypothetical protein